MSDSDSDHHVIWQVIRRTDQKSTEPSRKRTSPQNRGETSRKRSRPALAQNLGEWSRQRGRPALPRTIRGTLLNYV